MKEERMYFIFVSVIALTTFFRITTGAAILSDNYLRIEFVENGSNDLYLRCDNLAEGSLVFGATYEFFDGLGESTPSLVRTAEDTELPYSVDQQSERFVRCAQDGEVSNFLAIGGKLLFLHVSLGPHS